jgi:hypothetical protein
LTVAERKAVARTIATRYKQADKASKAKMLDELCAGTGWHRDHARKALRGALQPRPVKQRAPQPPKYGSEVIAPLIFCWATLGMPTGKRLAPILPELVPILRRCHELNIDDDTATLLASISPATIDRRLAGERKKYEPNALSYTKPGLSLKSQVPIRIWTDWNNAIPGFVEADLVSHDGGYAAGDHDWTLTLTDIATGWTEHRSMSNTDRTWVHAALDDIVNAMPFPILGLDTGNESESINHHLLAWCEQHKVTFTRSRPGNKNKDCHPEQKSWAIVHGVVGYHRYDTAAELLLLNKIWALQSQLANYFCAHQKLVSKVRIGAKISKKYDRAATPHRRTASHEKVSGRDKSILADTYAGINPAAVQRHIKALTIELLALATGKPGARRFI